MPFRVVRDRASRAEELLPQGWQLFARPTNLEPPGTIFRIDSNGARYIVQRLEVTITTGAEPGEVFQRSIETRLSLVARLLGLVPGMEASARRTEAIAFEIGHPVRQSTTDVDIERALAPVLADFPFKAGNRYFIIRETRTATSMRYRLTQGQALALGADGLPVGAGAISASVEASTDGFTSIEQTFPEPLAVMFLPEEITPVRSGLADDVASLGRVAVRAPLEWGEPDYAVVRVHYGTDRTPSAPDPLPGFGPGRGELVYGRCDVSIPRDHRMGDLESPSIWRLEFREDPARHVVVLDVTAQTRAEFMGELATRAQRARQALLFVHGYNVAFTDAVRRTAQLAYDLGASGPPMCFSWPSQGSVPGYTVDEANIEWAERDLLTFLMTVLEVATVERLYVLGHSMGTRGVTRALMRLLAGHPALATRVREVILAAPDIDRDVFLRDVAPALHAVGMPVTLYASSRDKALAASRTVHGTARAGDVDGGVVVAPGVETIDASAVETGFLGHSYFAEEKSLIGDITELLHHGSRASSRRRLEAVNAGAAGQFWRFREG